MAHADSLRASAQSAATVLCSYLAAKGQTLALASAIEICNRLPLAGQNDIKPLARPLRVALSEHAITLKQSHALEVLARIAGHDCYMRAKQASAEPAAVYVLLCTVDGTMRPPTGFPSIGEAVTAMLGTAIELIPSRSQSAFCTMSRYESGVQLEMSQQSGSWLTIQLIKFREDSLSRESVVPLPLGEESLRVALRKIVGGIEHARPATLVVRGTVADTLPPTFCAAFHLTALTNRAARLVSDERELFLLFDATGCDRIRSDHGDCIVEGRDESYRVEVAWVDVTGADQQGRKTELTTTMQSVFDRYTRYRQALPGTVSEALLSVGGSSNLGWSAHADYKVIESLSAEQGKTIADLAAMVGVEFRDVMRIKDFELAAPSLIIELAVALTVAPNKLLLEREHSLGFSADNAEQFTRMVSGAMAYRCIEGDSLGALHLAEARRFLETAKDIAEIIAFDSGDFAMMDGDEATEPTSRHDAMAAELLEDACACGVKLIFSREVEFVPTGNKTVDGGFLAMNVLTICAERSDGAKPAMWSTID
ncbi:hypothetical protein ABH945_003761 [Paraburkholderia sp. GAS333]|uniref:hypothetical protein n=1 Tax=Paraburkholderia sp. GAS333 TaxID=3156279 RepID=UPI003D263686